MITLFRNQFCIIINLINLPWSSKVLEVGDLIVNFKVFSVLLSCFTESVAGSQSLALDIVRPDFVNLLEE